MAVTNTKFCIKHRTLQFLKLYTDRCKHQKRATYKLSPLNCVPATTIYLLDMKMTDGTQLQPLGPLPVWITD